MSRWRPPTKPASKYITPEGYRAMNEELQYLWKVKRPAVTQAVQEAAAQGDRSENAEYIYGKRQLREIDRRIRFLSRRLDDMTVVDRPPQDSAKIYFAAWVTLYDISTEEEKRFRIVGPDETDAKKGWISVDSPLARALIGKQVDDEIVFATPKGRQEYEVVNIEYDEAKEHR